MTTEANTTPSADDIHEVDASCSPGSYCPPGFGECIQCETGTYASAAMATVCTQCVAGKYSEFNGATQCAPCPAGKFSFFNGSSVCSSCPSQTGSAAGMGLCVTCSNSSSSGCKYADGSACPLCSGACALCNPGYYNDGGSNRCLACGPGTFLSSKGATSSAACTGCLSGTYTKPTSTGLSACLQCSVNVAMSLPQNAVYFDAGFDPMLCNWKCEPGFQTMAASPAQGSDELDALSTIYQSQGYSPAAIVLMIKYRSDYCCDASKVTVGTWRQGCTKDSAGTIAACPLIANGQFVFVDNTDSLNRCGDWVCNAGYYKFNGVCNPQPVCGAGETYARDSSSGLVVAQQSGVYSCVGCPVCVGGSETAVPCNSTHSAVCRMCGGDRVFSVGGGPCVKEPPIGYRGARTTFSSIPAWGVRPALTFDNRVFVWATSTVFYSYVVCAAAGVGRVFTGGDAVCNPLTDGFCDQCSTQCSPWQRSSWFQGVGWYGSSSACTMCQFDPAMCTGDQFLNMSACGPVGPPQCAICPSAMPVSNQVGWVNPRDGAFNGLYPCRVVCAAGYSEVNDQCVQCGSLPANVILVNGCEWRCKAGYLQNGNQCEACPVQSDCAVGLYPDYQGSSNVCLSCMECQKPANAVFVTGGTFGVSTSCAYTCESGFYRSGDLCVACNQQRSCVLGTTFLIPCTDTVDSQCSACRQCSVGETLLQPCTAGNNSVCAACDSGLKPGNASWTAVGCGSWACVSGFWRDGSVCRQCSVQKECGVGTTLQIMASVCSSSTGKCVSCPALLAGECFNGDPYCGTTRVCGITTPVLISTPRLTTTATPRPTTTTTASIRSTLGATVRTTTTTPPAAPPPTTTARPEAFASLASLTMNPNVTINAELFDGLARNVSALVCADVVGFCNVSVLAVTVNNVTTFCTNGVCPGYARRRRLLGVAVVVVSVGIVTQTQITDVSEGFNSIEAVSSSSVLPNSPVENLTRILGDSRRIMQQVQTGFTVFILIQPVPVVVDNTTTVVAVACAVVVVIAAVALMVIRKNRHQQGALVMDKDMKARFTALDSIRITKENFKPFVKTN